MLYEPLARDIMRVAAEHNIQAGEVLPEKAFDLLLEENPETIGEALMELYLRGLLEEVPHEVDRLTQAGAEYIYGE
jgi:hypothetical protein